MFGKLRALLGKLLDTRLPETAHKKKEIREPRVYPHENITYIRMSELTKADGEQLAVWIYDQGRPIIPGLEPQDAVYSWDYETWKRVNDPAEKLMQEVSLEMIDINSYTEEEIREAHSLAFIEMDDTPWPLYLPVVRKSKYREDEPN